MGLTSFKGAVVRKGDINISKNYLFEDEITDLNRIVTMFLEHAEDMARDKTLNEFLKFRRREILEGKGKVSREEMERNAFKGIRKNAAVSVSKELRRMHEIQENDLMEIFIEGKN